ncbi:MAG: hypothetical protein ACFFGZ_15315, partial [Candidatus Thorarchaeota archaeon]
MIRRIKPLFKETFLCFIILALLLGMITAIPMVSSRGSSSGLSEPPGTSPSKPLVSPTLLNNGNETAENETVAQYKPPVNLTTMLNFLDDVLNDSQNLHSDQPNEHLSLIATYQATFIARVLGLDHFKDQANIYGIIDLAADQDLGFRINNETASASIAATFGAVNTLYMLNSTDLVNSTAIKSFLQSRYNSTEKRFRDLGTTGALLATYQAVQVDQILQTAVVTSSMVEEIVSFLETLWKDGYFLDPNLRKDPFIQTWIAVSLLEALNTTKAVLVNGTQLEGYAGQVNSWVIDNYNASLANNSLNLPDAAATLLTLQKLNRLDSSGLNMTEVVEFISSSQQAETENARLEGGFGASPTADETTASIENSFMAVLGLLAIGRVFENLTMALSTTTAVGKILPHQVIQGDNETLYFRFELFNSTTPAVDFLNLSIMIDGTNSNWTLSEPAYFPQSRYSSIIQSSDNWTLGNHTVKVFANLERVPFISLPDHLFEDYITVAYETIATTNMSNYIRPTEAIQMNLQIMNRSAITHESRNVTNTNVNITIRYPIDGKYRNLTNAVWNGSTTPSNDTTAFTLETDGLTTINFTIPNRVVLGDYTVKIANGTTGHPLTKFYVRVYVADTQFQIQALNDTLNFCTSRNDSTLTPGKVFNLTATMKYTVPGLRLPNSALNASFVITSIINASLSFAIPLEFWKDINETTVYRSVENTTVPRRPLMGNFSVQVEFTWNTSTGYIKSPILDYSMPLVWVGGTPIAQNATIIAPSGNLSSGPVTVYYGEHVNSSFELAINETRISLLEDIPVKAYLWNMSGGLVAEMTYLNQTNATHPFTAAIDPNLPHDDYQIAVQLTLPHNGTVLNITHFYRQGAAAPMVFQEFRFTLDGALSILESSIRYITASNEQNQTALDEFPIFSASFQIRCPESGETITGIDMYGELVGQENITFLDVGFSKTEKYYQVWVPVKDLPEGAYELELYTHTAISSNTLVGSVHFELVETL